MDGLCAAGIVDPETTGLVWLDCQKQEQDALLAASTLIKHRVPIVFVLRPRSLVRSSPLIDALAGYEEFVDLRRPVANGCWRAERKPIEGLVSLAQRRRGLTDVLVL